MSKQGFNFFFFLLPTIPENPFYPMDVKQLHRNNTWKRREMTSKKKKRIFSILGYAIVRHPMEIELTTRCAWESSHHSKWPLITVINADVQWFTRFKDFCNNQKPFLMSFIYCSVMFIHQDGTRFLHPQ